MVSVTASCFLNKFRHEALRMNCIAIFEVVRVRAQKMNKDAFLDLNFCKKVV